MYAGFQKKYLCLFRLNCTHPAIIAVQHTTFHSSISLKSFTALSKIPFFTYPAIMAVHGTTFLSGIFWKSLIASSKYPFWAYPVNILFHETKFHSVILSNILHATSTKPHFATHVYKTVSQKKNWIVLHFLLFHDDIPYRV